MIDAAAGFVARTPALSSALTVSNLRVSARSGSTLDVVAADAASAWGLRPAFVVCDEFCMWPNTRNAKGLWQAVASAMGKVRGAKLLCATTSGDPAHWTHPIYEAALRSPQWSVQDVPGPLPWVSEAFLREQRATLPDSVFARLHENRWTQGEDRLTNVDDVRACVTLAGPLDPLPSRRYVIALDLGLVNDRTVAAVMHSEIIETEGRVVVQRHLLDRMETWEGVARQAGRPRCRRGVGSAPQRAPSGPRSSLTPGRARAWSSGSARWGYSVEDFQFSRQSTGRLAMTLHTTIRDHRLSIPDDPDLIDELLNVRLRETSPNVYRLDHDADQHDDRAVAVAMALVDLTTAPRGGRPVIFGDDKPGSDRTLAAIGKPELQQPYGLPFVGSFASDLESYNPDDVGRTKPSPFRQ